MAVIKSSGTLSSDGIQTTNTTNMVITFEHPVNSLVFSAEGNNLNIIINDEINKHLIKADCIFSIEDISIYKITILESGKSYSYDALYY